tara:strand:- start:611 stop:832 length:222 start_codon:yes stop_codon:yes gene_type:complete
MFKFATLAIVALFAADTNALTVTQRSAMRTQIDEAIDSYLNQQETGTATSNAEWGFLKNIVNIDRFFDSGVKA